MSCCFDRDDEDNALDGWVTGGDVDFSDDDDTEESTPLQANMGVE